MIANVDRTDHIDGTVVMSRPGIVPQGSVLTVTLEDVSRMDVKSETLGVCVIDDLGALPVSFSIPFDRTLVVHEHAYGVRARIEFGGRLLYTTDTNHAVLTRGASNTVHLSVVPVSTGDRT